MSRRMLRILWNLIVISAVVVYAARFHKYSKEEILFPELVAFPVLGLAVISLVNEGLGALRSKHLEDKVKIDQIALPDLGLGILFGLSYLLLWLPLGFILDTVVFLFIAPLLLRYSRRQAPILGCIAVTTALLFSYLFHLGSGAILPSGFLNVGWF